MVFSRRERILEMINTRGSVSIKELERAFPEVSSMTIRRDLQVLDENGSIIRVRRGARAAMSAHETGTVEPVFDMRMNENLAAKDRIAALALTLIEPGRSIYMDTGTTVARLARILPDDDYSIITGAPNIAIEISKRNRPNLFMLGGRLIKDNLSVVGENALDELDSFNIDTAVMSASGYTEKSGFTCGNHDERALKEKVIAKARHTILLMDSSKYGRSLPLTFAMAGDISRLVMDADDDAVIQCLAKDGICVAPA